MGAPSSLQEGFAKWTASFAGLRKAFCQILLEEGAAKLAAFLEGCFSNPGTADRSGVRETLSPRYCQALSIVFQLLDVVEENTANQIRRRVDDPGWREGEPGYWL
jgi:hypothetical protein